MTASHQDPPDSYLSSWLVWPVVIFGKYGFENLFFPVELCTHFEYLQIEFSFPALNPNL
jgi:hypothetical protein